MPKPTLTRWSAREVPSADLMNTRVTIPQKYYAKLPYVSVRGVKVGTAFPGGVPPNQPLYAGQRRDVTWDPARQYKTGGFSSPDNVRFRIPEDGVYHVVFNAAVYGSTVRSVGENVNAYLEVDGATGAGVSGNIGHTIYQHQQAGGHTTIRVSVTEFFTKGSSVRAQMYLDSGATGTWGIAAADFDANFHAFMISPSSNGWSQPAAEPPSLTPWKAGSVVSVEAMNAATYDPYVHLENRPRFTARGTQFSVAASQEKVALAWDSMYANDPGFGLRRLGDGFADRTAVTVPYSGIYLVSLFCSARHADGADSASYGFQAKIHGSSSDAKILAQGSTTRIGQDCSVSLDDVLYLNAGEALNIRFYGWGSSTRWVNGDSDGRINTLGAIYLGT
ncbi:hypothetical protein M1P56_09830 [Streptomyces sp. HU2014]|uniref:hypothetical protein n=1 Tax=Streptomyces sp. HU2014 TaxID=2939414 RepID=UPI00200F87F3|nr:hypothetical protein [Streptomyces sp. HU2014]UQI44625.1 hypothetical protein M1P56_09830 [Streptomyces sp. HU2014]